MFCVNTLQSVEIVLHFLLLFLKGRLLMPKEALDKFPSSNSTIWVLVDRLVQTQDHIHTHDDFHTMDSKMFPQSLNKHRHEAKSKPAVTISTPRSVKVVADASNENSSSTCLGYDGFMCLYLAFSSH